MHITSEYPGLAIARAVCAAALANATREPHPAPNAPETDRTAPPAPQTRPIRGL